MSVNIHNKLGDILTQLENITGINEKDELKAALINKKISISDTDNISDMVNKINNAILGSAKPNQVLKDVTFSSNDGLNQKGTATIESMGGIVAKGNAQPTDVLKGKTFSNKDNNNLIGTFDPIIQYSNLEPYYETIQGNGWSKTLEGNVTNIKVNTLGDMSVFVSDDKNNLYKFDTNGNQKWKVNIGLKINYIDCDPSGNIYLSCLSDSNIYVPTKCFKYDSNGNKSFEYIRHDDKGGTLDCIFSKYDILTKHIIVLYTISNSAGSFCFLNIYDNINNLILNVVIPNRIQYEGIEFCGCLSTGELIIFTNTNFNYTINKFNLNGDSIASTVLNNSPSYAAFNIINDNRIAIYRSASNGTGAFFEILDSNFNRVQESISILMFDIIRNKLDFKALSDYSFISCRDSGSTNTNKVCISKYNEVDNNFEFTKEIDSGLFDYDNKFLYYSKFQTNKISKIEFDSNYIKKNIDADLYNNFSSYKQLAIDENDNIYDIDMSMGNVFSLTKYDTNLNVIYNKIINAPNFGNSGSGNNILNLFFYENSKLYLFTTLYTTKTESFLNIFDLNGNSVSVKNLGSIYVNNLSGSRGIYDSKNKNAIFIFSGTLIKYDLNGSIILTKDLSINSKYISMDSNGNIYVYTDKNNINKYNNDGDYIYSINDVLGPAIIDDNSVENNVYIRSKNDNSYYGLRIYNSSGSYTGNLINALLYSINGGICKNSIIYITGSNLSGKTNNIICIANSNNIDDPIYFYIDDEIHNTSNILFDSNNNIIFMNCGYTQTNPHNYLYKIPSIKNTNPYKVFKGYKLVNVTQ